MFSGILISQPSDIESEGDILVIKITESRIALQEAFEVSDNKDFNTIYQQTLNLEESLAEYFYMRSNDTLAINNSFNPQVVLARMIYINAKTWCMTEPLKKRTDFLFATKKEETVENMNNLIKISSVTNKVDSNIERAKRFDRLQYRYNSSVVVSNWEHTVDNLKIISKDLKSLDQEFQKSYRMMLADMYSMIGLLDMYKSY